ncbi:MAG TPA: Uma2 family endonuclease [Dehalococcoidia bacterium]|nr:Uma2 family endonuclease [Dehalococcoidia bacterium]
MVTKRTGKQPNPPAPAPALERRRFSIDEYDRMIAAGILCEDERVELLEGAIVCMAPIGVRHVAAVHRLTTRFSRELPDVIVSVQNPIRLPQGSEPQPDVAILRPREDFYESGLPGPADVLLLIEIADTSLEYDRDVKLPLYAAAGSIEVWIEDLNGERMLVYREPKDGQYTRMQVIERGGTLAPLAFPELTLALDDLLGSRRKP